MQVFSALRDLYGRDGAQTISGLCGTRVVLAAPDKDTSEWSAASLGRVEVETLSEGVSYETARDGVTLSTRREERPLVLPSEVSRLENLSGYLKFPGPSPVARIRLKYRKRDIVAARFVPRSGDSHDRNRAGRQKAWVTYVTDDGAVPARDVPQSGTPPTAKTEPPPETAAGAHVGMPPSDADDDAPNGPERLPPESTSADRAGNEAESPSDKSGGKAATGTPAQEAETQPPWVKF